MGQSSSLSQIINYNLQEQKTNLGFITIYLHDLAEFFFCNNIGTFCYDNSVPYVINNASKFICYLMDVHREYLLGTHMSI